LLADLLCQTGYQVLLLRLPLTEVARPEISLLIADADAARRHGVALLALKRSLEPVFLPLLLTLSGRVRAGNWLRAGFDDVLRLPLNKDDLLARVEAFLRLRRHAEDLRREDQRRFRSTFDLVPAGIVHLSTDGRLLLANPQFCMLLGYAETELAALPMQEMMRPDPDGEVDAAVSGCRFDRRYLRKDGQEVWTSVTLAQVCDAEGHPTYRVGVIKDITERKRMEEALSESARFGHSTIDALAQHICVTDEHGNILAVNRAWQEFAITNDLPGDPGSTRWNYFEVCAQANGADGEARAFADGMRAVASGQHDTFSIEYPCHSPDTQRWFNATVTRFAGEGPVRLVIAHENITAIKQAEKELLQLVHYDTLTGLPNRSLLIRRLSEAVDMSVRSGKLPSVLCLGLDRFKGVNNTLSHKAGDTLLQKVARRLLEITRTADTVARFGGDVFVLVVSEPAGSGVALGVVERAMAAVARPLLVEGQEFFLSCSVGVATYPGDGADPIDLVEHANIAMYRSKELGRNCYQFYAAAMNEAARERLRLESLLRQALERGEFLLHFQPQADLRSGRIVGCEALLRWQHPELGMIMPDRFIKLAEETGLIIPLGAWVLRTACMQCRAWQLAGLGQVRMAVNLSARQFVQHDLVKAVMDVLIDTGLAPECLDIELTESAVMANVEQAIATLHTLKALGVKLSVDDFGTGYSSLAYLRRFPIDVLKIDQSFVRDMLEPGQAAIPNAIISMAHSLGIEVIAEGVETQAQCEFLSRNMCDQIQGYWLGRPMDHASFERLLCTQVCLPPAVLRLNTPARTLLLVDDERNIVAALRRLLRNDGYQILVAYSGQEGLDVLERHHVDVILTDQRMAGMTGVAFLRTARCLYPHTVRIVLSGYTDLQSVIDAVNEGSAYRFLTKPWDDEQLRRHIAETFEHKEMADENRRLNMKLLTANQELAASNRRLESVLIAHRSSVSAVGPAVPQRAVSAALPHLALMGPVAPSAV